MEQKKITNKKNNLFNNSKKSILNVIFSRFVLIALFLFLQIAFILVFLIEFETYLPQFYSFNIVLSVFLLLYLINTQIDPTAKLTWLVLFTVFPVFGALLFGYTLSDFGHRALKKRTDNIKKNTMFALDHNASTLEKLSKIDNRASNICKYLQKCGCHPLYDNTSVKYLKSGEVMFEELLKAIKSAEKYIFMEYFIIEHGKMWQEILDVLAEKAASGVDVRVIYDGRCEFSMLPHSYPKTLGEMGIKCKVFAPIMPFLSTHYNYRDHRKITVVDGKTAFTGGINIADEYINAKKRFGYWKDCAIMLCGQAAESFALMFMQMWNVERGANDFSFIKNDVQNDVSENVFVMPYSDCPLDNDKVGERVYVDMLNRSEKYVHIMTPYLILDCVTENAIKFAAERGVEVSVVLPGIPDKKIPYALAKSHYSSLISSGVKIYEYTPGFLHSKVVVSDDKEAVVGTINLDYRSLYHHFECAAYIYGKDAVAEIETDFEDTVNQSKTVTAQTAKNEKISTKLLGFLMKILAPLL